MTTHEITLDGVPVRWREAGDGPPVVLVHGLPTGPGLWRRVLPWLPGVRACCLEMTGYAGSIPAGVGRDLSLSAQADRLLTWLDRLALGPAVLVGHDLGGGVAQIAAVRRPAACAGLVLANAVAYDAWPVAPVRALRAAPAAVARLPTPVVRAGLWPAVLAAHDQWAVARESFARHFRPYAEHGAGAALARQTAALDARDTAAVADRLPRLGVAARVVWGRADPFLPPALGQRLAADLGTRAWAVPGGRHFTPEDHPRVLAGAIRDVVVAGR